MTPLRYKACRMGFVLVTITALIVLAGCNKRSSEELRVGVNPWPGYEALYLAQHRGLFDREGIKVKLVDFQSLGDARRAFERGRSMFLPQPSLKCSHLTIIQGATPRLSMPSTFQTAQTCCLLTRASQV